MCADIPDALTLIYRRAREGMIRTRAARLVVDGQRADDVLIPEQFWWAADGTALESNWQIGDFSTWIEHRSHWQAFGVEFEKAGLQSISSIILPVAQITSPTNAQVASPLENDNLKDEKPEPVPRKRAAKWDDWIAYLSLCVFEGRVLATSTPTDALNAISSRMADDGIDEMARETVRSSMNQTLRVLKAKDAD